MPMLAGHTKIGALFLGKVGGIPGLLLRFVG